MNPFIRQLCGPRCGRPAAFILAFLAWLSPAVAAADNEYVGKFEPQLVANDDDLEQVIFKPLRDLAKIEFAKPIEDGATVTAGRLTYLRAAYSRFQARGFEILGMNTDEDEILPQVKSILAKNGMTWLQARRQSITAIIRSLRIHAYPTTVLLGPDGRVISLNNARKGQPSLRGQERLKSLDQLLGP